ncbi:MAG: DUF4398 domain-containing protein [Pseudomonadota bacterium]
MQSKHSVTLVSLLALAISACATVPPPTDAMAAAEAAVARADASRAGDSSAPELRAARGKLESARGAMSSGDMLAATRLVTEARLDADLAAARSEAARAQFNVEATRKSNEALRQQALRNSVNVSPIAIPAPVQDAPNGNY